MIDLSKIKLIVWDLDDTFWSGTLSEEKVKPINANIQLVHDTTDCGIINSICSKNDLEPAKTQLQELGVWDEFVFASINWEGKGARLAQLIDNMALRPINVLFLDDNTSNLGEAQHYLPDLQVGTPDIIPDLIAQLATMPPKDTVHKRLKQYKVLEQKAEESKSFGSNEEFLYSSHIRVEMHTDCLDKIERLHELILRTNQLNFTKKRITIEEMDSMLKNPAYTCGYVTVIDRFGDYGIIGFYAVCSGVAEHFLFSCRTMGQYIEQWVYAQLGFPKIEVVEPVRTKLNKTDCPKWINQQTQETQETKQSSSTAKSECKILLKGPCDLLNAHMYIKNAKVFDSEFTYVNPSNGQIIESYNHHIHIIGQHEYSDEENAQIAKDCMFVDPNMLRGKMFTNEYDIVFLSALVEPACSIYRKKGTQIKVAFSGVDLTNPQNWENSITGKVYNGHNHFTREFLTNFSEKYEYVGVTTPDDYVAFLKKCLQWLPNTIICIILGVTKFYPYAEAEKEEHKLLNDAVKALAKEEKRIKVVEIDHCVSGPQDFTDGLNHYTARVYYNIAQEMIRVINQVKPGKIKSSGGGTLVYHKVLESIRYTLSHALDPHSGLYSALRKIYYKLSGKR